ncbi:MAG: hypothetical protein GOVbin4296_3 [Prokaryotic dsDNA virus sp.]|nr:MAG: hypothetical protein GOVbin4296_3 [Prokaryotic dsDNA virus sp.]|tara:strand:- start:2780 stop:3463 length:684 start_codon:yes stop_codon:yes gene_type:complete
MPHGGGHGNMNFGGDLPGGGSSGFNPGGSSGGSSSFSQDINMGQNYGQNNMTSSNFSTSSSGFSSGMAAGFALADFMSFGKDKDKDDKDEKGWKEKARDKGKEWWAGIKEKYTEIIDSIGPVGGGEPTIQGPSTTTIGGWNSGMHDPLSHFVDNSGFYGQELLDPFSVKYQDGDKTQEGSRSNKKLPPQEDFNLELCYSSEGDPIPCGTYGGECTQGQIELEDGTCV